MDDLGSIQYLRKIFSLLKFGNVTCEHRRPIKLTQVLLSQFLPVVHGFGFSFFISKVHVHRVFARTMAGVWHGAPFVDSAVSVCVLTVD